MKNYTSVSVGDIELDKFTSKTTKYVIDITSHLSLIKQSLDNSVNGMRYNILDRTSEYNKVTTSLYFLLFFHTLKKYNSPTNRITDYCYVTASNGIEFYIAEPLYSLVLKYEHLFHTDERGHILTLFSNDDGVIDEVNDCIKTILSRYGIVDAIEIETKIASNHSDILSFQNVINPHFDNKKISYEHYVNNGNALVVLLYDMSYSTDLISLLESADINYTIRETTSRLQVYIENDFTYTMSYLKLMNVLKYCDTIYLCGGNLAEIHKLLSS